MCGAHAHTDTNTPHTNRIIPGRTLEQTQKRGRECQGAFPRYFLGGARPCERAKWGRGEGLRREMIVNELSSVKARR